MALEAGQIPAYSNLILSMERNFETPFDNIESAQEYLALLTQALEEATANAEADILGQTNSHTARRRDALRLVLYKLEKLERHIKVSRRLLNDLRTLRRLLLDERAEAVGVGPGTREKAN